MSSDHDSGDAPINPFALTTTNTQPPVEEKDKPMSIKIKDQNGTEVFFKVRASTKFMKIFNAYAKRLGGPMEDYRFLFDGQRVNQEQCPFDLQMEDEDVVDCFVQQTGGGVAM
jgi:small ubiquitin-related modifier